jgi:hypothetical protein
MVQGMSRLDAIRQIGVVEQTYYRWRKQYGGMGIDKSFFIKTVNECGSLWSIRIKLISIKKLACLAPP